MFYELRFPEEIPIKSKTLLEFDTNVVTAKNGEEHRTANRKCRMVYSVLGDLRTEGEIARIRDFFRLVQGRAIGFRYKDWLDFHGERQVIAEADGLATHFQLLKAYHNPEDGSLSYLRRITKPVKDTLRVYLDDEETDQFEVDYTTGVLVLPVAPNESSIVRASFDFDVPVRFDTDRLEINMRDLSSGEVGPLVLVEIG
ncbi:MAG: DUF2460 domain-containing protein [Rickettsiales bacterium]|jgi:uncharacterized protein (TIGR02217 family)|nr:DUF2460 domain-containing protein [Rickettsiales bacterium]